MAHDIRDTLVDFVSTWSDRTGIPIGRFLHWIGLSKSKFYDWKKRYGQLNEHNALIPRDHWLTADEQERICSFARAHPLEGYRRLTFLMMDANVVACSPSSVYRVLLKAGLLSGHAPKPTQKGKGFEQPLVPHQHWHIDISYIRICDTFYFLCSILDGCSRYIVHWEIREKMREKEVEIILQAAREKFPLAKPRIISDNGPQFIGKDWKELIRLFEMTHLRTSPYYPQSNGKIERWHKTLKGESIRIHIPLCVDEAIQIVADYTEHYNTVRLHSAIGFVTPRDKLEGRDQAIQEERDRKLAEARQRRQQIRTNSKASLEGTEAFRPVIDFDAFRKRLPITEVLRLLGFTSTKTYGKQLRGPCPLHGSKPGTAQCFAAHTEKQTFKCFKCGKSGNALDLWSLARQKSIYDAAIELSERLHIPLPTRNTESSQ